MHYRNFGRTGWKVSEIGFGAWQIGGSWGTVDDVASIRTLLYAFEQRLNFVDTAELCGAGHSETVIGQALRQWAGGKIYVATKAQPTVWPNAETLTRRCGIEGGSCTLLQHLGRGRDAPRSGA